MNYRELRSYLNCEKAVFPGVGEYDFPALQPEEVDLEGAEIIGFNYALTEKHPENKIVHFHLDDYQFERVWSSADRYIEVLSRFRAVLSPDFSMYQDFPKAVCLFNHYRKQWCGAYWQSHGIKVIPTVGWSDEESFNWCFDGIPKNALVSISTVGSQKNPDVRNEFLRGFDRAVEVLQPSRILLIGKKFPWIKYDGDMVVVQAQNIENLQKRSRGE